MKSNAQLFMLCLLLMGCSGTMPANKIDEGAAQAPEVIAEASAGDVVDASIINRIKVINQETSVLKILTLSDKIFFNLSMWQNKRMTTSKDFQSFVDRVSTAALMSQNTDPNSKVTQDFWPKLSVLIDGLCADNLKSCTTINTFRTTPQGAELLRKLGELQTNLDKMYKYYFIGIDLQNQNFPAVAVDSFLKDAKQYRSKLISEISAAEKSGQLPLADAKNALLTKMNVTLDLVISLVKEGKVKTTNTEWIRDLNLTSSVKESDTELAARYAVYEKNSKNLTAEMKSEITRMQQLAGSFDKKMSQVTPQTLQAFEIKSIPHDEYFYVIDQVYSSRWSTKQGEVFIKTAGLDPQKILSAGQNYLRSDVAHLVHLAQIDLKTLLATCNHVETINLFSFAQQTLSKSSIESIGLPEKAEKISQLIRASALSIKQGDLFAAQVTALHKTIKKTIVYPTTMIVLTLLNRAGVAATDQLRGIDCAGDIRPNFSFCVTSFFLGNLKPAFAFTNDESKLTPIELLESIELASKIGVFEAANTTPDEIVTTLFDILTNDKNGKLNAEIEHLNIKYSSAEWSELQVLAKAIQANTQVARTISINEMIYSPTLGSAMPALNNSNGTDQSSPGYFTASNRLSEQLETIRSDLFSLFQYFSTMQTTLQKSGTPMPKLQGRLLKLKTSAKAFVSILLQRTQEFDQTYFPIVDQELKYTNTLIKYEAAYWKSVHQQMKKLRAAKSSQQITSTETDMNLPIGTKYRSVVSADSVSSYEFDFLLRTRQYLQSGLPTSALPAINPSLRIQIPAGFENSPLYRNSKVNLVNFVEDETTFIRNAINSTGISGSGTQVQWYHGSYLQIYAFRNYYDIKTILYRMGPLAQRYLGMNTITKEQLVNAPLQVLQHFNQSIDEKQVLQLLGKTTRYNLEQLDGYGIFFEAIDNHAAPIYDYLLTELYKRGMSRFGHSDISDDSGAEMNLPWGFIPIPVAAEQIAQYNINMSMALFSTHLSAAADLTDVYKLTVADDLKLLNDAKAAVQSMQARLADFTQINYQTDKTLPLSLVSSYVLKNVEAYQINFHNRTSTFYK